MDRESPVSVPCNFNVFLKKASDGEPLGRATNTQPLLS